MQNTLTVRGINETLSRNVRKHRKRNGMSIAQLSKVSKLSSITVQRLDAGYSTTRHAPNMRTVLRLSKALKVTPHELIKAR